MKKNKNCSNLTSSRKNYQRKNKVNFWDPIIFFKAIGVFIGISMVLLLIIYFIKPKEREMENYLSEMTNSFLVGGNVSGIVHYGYGDIFPWADTGHVDLNLKELQAMGASVIRVFVPNNKVSDSESARRLALFLDKAASYDLYVIPVLIDLYGTGYNPQACSAYYTDYWDGTSLLNQEFFTEGYNNCFKNFINTVITENKNAENIYAWEIGNELKANNLEVFVSFMNDMSSYIKSIDPSHLVSTGMMYASHIPGGSPENIYPNLPNVDLVTIHAYDGSRAGEGDAIWAIKNGKFFLVEEFSYGSSTEFDPYEIYNRYEKMKYEIGFWKNLGASGIAQWGFMAKEIYYDNGNGDKRFGMDMIWHSNDYQDLYDMYRKYAGPICNLDEVNLSVNSFDFSSSTGSIIEVGDKINLEINGDASTYFEDLISPEGIVCPRNSYGDFAFDWTSTGAVISCDVTKAGNFTWTHIWKKCEESFDYCSKECSESISFEVVESPTPTPLLSCQDCFKGKCDGVCNLNKENLLCPDCVNYGGSTPSAKIIPSPRDCSECFKGKCDGFCNPNKDLLTCPDCTNYK